MFDRIIGLSIEKRAIVLLVVIAMAVLGFYNFKQLPIDAVPDITNVQVQINTEAPGYSPLEAEQRITFPIETVMGGLPHLEQTRSISRYGLSQVTVVFKDGTDIYFARQLVNERIQEIKGQLPTGIEPAMGPIATGLGEIYLWTVEAEPGAKKPDGTPYTLTDLREIQDWIVKPQLRTVPGVTEINTIGGYEKEYHVAPAPEKLAAYKLTMADLVTALESNNTNVGAGYIERRGEQYLVRLPGQVRSIDDLKNTILTHINGTSIRIKDVAEVDIGRELRTGAATENGQEVVLGTVFMLMGENSRKVSQAVDKRMVEISSTLPKGVKALTVYDRTTLVDRTINTVKGNLLMGAVLVIVVLFVFLGNLRAAVITALVIPLSMLFTFTGMVTNHVSANLLSLGALDFGIIVDGAVVIVENCIRRLALAQAAVSRPLAREERFHEVFIAAQETRRPVIYGQLIIMIVYLPIFVLSGIEGKMFQPMAFTVVTALLGAMVLSITFVPAMVAMFVTKVHSEKDSRLMRFLENAYAPLLERVLAAQPIVLALVAAIVILSALLTTRLGSEFIPSLNEGDFAVQALRAPGTSLTQAVTMQQQLEKTLKAKFPEIARVFSRTGTAEVASDVMPPNLSDSIVMLKPESEWPKPQKTHAELITTVQAEVAQIPGSSYEFSQPVQLRMNELISGVRSDVAIKLYGDDMQILANTGAQLGAVLERVPGAADVNVEQTTGLPMLTIQIDREKAARHGINVGDIQNNVATAIGGQTAGMLFEGDRRFKIVVRLPEHVRHDVEAIKRLPVALPALDDKRPGGFVPLAEVASIELIPGPNQISRENGKRRIVVTANVRDRDIGTFVKAAKAAIQKEVQLPAGYWANWSGQFENLSSAAKRLQIVIPLALALVFMLLFAMFKNIKDGLLVFSGIPFALSGGVAALWITNIPLSISAGVGFIALSGVAVLNGLVMVTFIRSLRDTGLELDDAIRNGTLVRLRPVLMTALVASLGFLPMALATGTGAEVQRPLATVVIGGIISSTILTLLVTPLLYRMAYRRYSVIIK